MGYTPHIGGPSPRIPPYIVSECQFGGDNPLYCAKKIFGEKNDLFGIFILKSKYIMKKIIRLTETDLSRLVKKVIKEQMDVSSDSEYYQERKREVSIPFDDLAMLSSLASRFCENKENFPDCRQVRRIISRHSLFM